MVRTAARRRWGLVAVALANVVACSPDPTTDAESPARADGAPFTQAELTVGVLDALVEP